MKRRTMFPIMVGVIFALICMTATVSAQGAAPRPKAPPTTTSKRTAEAQLRTEKQRTEAQLLTLSLQELNVRLRILTDELKQFKTDLAEVTTLWRLMLLEQRQALLEQQLAEVQGQLRDFDAQEAAIRTRLQTLDREYIVTGSAFITRDEARRQIRQQLESQLTQIAARRTNLSEQEQQLRDPLNQLKTKLEEVKREMEAIERKRKAEGEEPEATKEP